MAHTLEKFGFLRCGLVLAGVNVTNHVHAQFLCRDGPVSVPIQPIEHERQHGRCIIRISPGDIPPLPPVNWGLPLSLGRKEKIIE